MSQTTRASLLVFAVVMTVVVLYGVFDPVLYGGRTVVYYKQMVLVDESHSPWWPSAVYKFYDSAGEYLGSVDANWGHLPMFPLRDMEFTKVLFFRRPGFVISWQEKAFPLWGHAVMILLLAAVPVYLWRMPRARLYVWVVYLALATVYWMCGILFHLGSLVVASIVLYAYTLFAYVRHHRHRFARV